MYAYPVELTPDTNGTLLVTFPDIPEAHTAGDDEADALVQGLEALECAFEIYFSQRRAIPAPSKPKRGQKVVKVPVLMAAKVLLSNEMVAQGVRKADLARLLDCDQVQVDRLLKMGHATKIESIEAALRALGKHLEVSLA
jgi:antitoxin HicB